MVHLISTAAVYELFCLLKKQCGCAAWERKIRELREGSAGNGEETFLNGLIKLQKEK